MCCFCVASYARALFSATVKGITLDDFCRILFGAILPIPEYEVSEDTFTQILRCSQNLNSEWVKSAKNAIPERIEHYFSQKVVRELDQQKHEALIIGLQEIIKADPMGDNVNLGSLSHMTKRQFLECETIPFTSILTDLFLYSVIHTDNKECKSFLKTINKKYCDQFICRRDTIKIYEPDSSVPLHSISKTLRGKSFERCFTKVHESKIGFKRPNHVRIYSLQSDSFRFSYSELQKYLENIIGFYMLSRTQVNDYEAEDELVRIFPDAVRLLKERYNASHRNICDALGGLLMYGFLEHELGAPKIMNSMELYQDGFISDGVHFLKLDGPMGDINQLVFGTSYLRGDLRLAVTEALGKVFKIQNNMAMEYRMIDPQALRQVFSPEEAKAIKRMVLPEKAVIDRPKDAFGIFLGYSADIPAKGEILDDEFEALLRKRLMLDIEDNIAFIYDKIKELGIENHSFYIYVLPFNDIESDIEKITESLLNVGGKLV